jgi:hypothetical protein
LLLLLLDFPNGLAKVAHGNSGRCAIAVRPWREYLPKPVNYLKLSKTGADKPQAGFGLRF